jgi:hypothetical protein
MFWIRLTAGHPTALLHLYVFFQGADEDNILEPARQAEREEPAAGDADSQVRVYQGRVPRLLLLRQLDTGIYVEQI